MRELMIGLTAIGIGAIAILYFGIWWMNRPIPPEPTEHGDGEP